MKIDYLLDSTMSCPLLIVLLFPFALSSCLPLWDTPQLPIFAIRQWRPNNISKNIDLKVILTKKRVYFSTTINKKNIILFCGIVWKYLSNLLNKTFTYICIGEIPHLILIGRMNRKLHVLFGS